MTYMASIHPFFRSLLYSLLDHVQLGTRSDGIHFVCNSRAKLLQRVAFVTGPSQSVTASSCSIHLTLKRENVHCMCIKHSEHAFH